jgi:hypothetical protein
MQVIEEEKELAIKAVRDGEERKSIIREAKLKLTEDECLALRGKVSELVEKVRVAEESHGVDQDAIASLKS